MAELSPAGKNALGYWSAIEGAAAQRQTTAELWQSINALAAERGLDTAGITLAGVNELRSLATGMQNARDALASSDPTFALEAEHIATAPWARTLEEQNTLAMYQVRFAHLVERGGQQVTEYRTVLIQGQLPDTVGNLSDLIATDAANLAAGYGVTNLGFSDVTILAV